MARLVMMAVVFAALATPFAAQAQTVGTGSADGRPLVGASPPLCTDRPTKAYAACPVPEGDFQIESDAVNWTRDTGGGVRVDTVYYTDPTVKYGVGASTDVEASIAPYVTARTSRDGRHRTVGGVGDLYLRVKQRLTSATAGIRATLIPYVKAPTARSGIGNGRWEGGAIMPVVFTLENGFKLNLGPEVDILADADRRGRHAQLVALADLSKSFGRTTAYVELWTAQNFDPARTIRQYSADVALAYLVTPSWQVDAGGNFGLNRETPAAQLYLGLSTRF